MTPTLTVEDLRAWSLRTGLSKRTGNIVHVPALATMVTKRLKAEGPYNVWYADDSVRHISVGPNGRAAVRSYSAHSDYARAAINAYLKERAQ